MKVNKEIINCDKCSLHKQCNRKVTGTGNEDADIMFIAEAPGAQEDKFGYPLIGKSGIMFNKILKRIGMNRNEAFITNVLKCRPPNNRNPLPIEIKHCKPFLKKQIKQIKPKVIVTLGKFASCLILNKKKKNTTFKNLSKTFKVNGIYVIPMYHPAYLLHNGSDISLVKKPIIKIKKLREKYV